MEITDFIPSGKRKKLCQIKGHYHCSIVGTCISLKELNKIKRKAEVKYSDSATEHEIHGIFVYLAGEDSLPSKLMTKLLDKKYLKDIRKFSGLKNDKELQNAWKEEYDKGNIPGPYWALMSHPYSSAKTLSNAFGEVHMLSHMIGRSTRADIKRVKRLEEENDTLKSKYKVIKQTYCSKFSKINEKYESEKNKNNHLSAELNYSKQKIDDLEATINSKDSSAYDRKIKELEYSNDFLTHENSLLQEKIKNLQKQLEKKEKSYEQKINLFCLNNKNFEKTKCNGCISEKCPGPDLCGKKILYVGGRKNTVSKYKEIAENHGAKFIYHDGGIESSKKTIDNAVFSADMVCCPVDCTSHDACLKLKKICKKTEKSFVPLRSAGASSFDHYLKNINYNQGQ